MPSKKLLILLCFIASTQAFSQFADDDFYYGFSGGLNYSAVSEVQTTLIRPVFSESTYSASDKNKLGYNLSAFVYLRFPNSKFAIQPAIGYVKRGGQFSYSDIESLEYDIHFDYSYVHISPIFKFYTAEGFNILFGPQLGFIINRSGLRYESNMPELGPDLQIQQSLREVLKGNSVASFVIGVGYDLPMGIGVDAQLQLGLTDTIETLANGFYFIENKNISSSLQFTFSYAIPFFK